MPWATVPRDILGTSLCGSIDWEESVPSTGRPLSRLPHFMNRAILRDLLLSFSVRSNRH